MDQDQREVYERIPWETIEKKGGDRQWMVYAVAGAIALGALAYSFVRNQPVAPVAGAPVASTVPATTAAADASSVPAPPATVTNPIVVAEADLYAVDPERLFDQAAGYAEWFAVEYMAVDGSEESRRVLASLLPVGVPLPEAAADIQVFVDWAGTTSITQTGPFTFEVDVAVRTLTSSGDSGFVRQLPRVVTVPVEIDDAGKARVSGVPAVEAMTLQTGVDLALGPAPEELRAQLEASQGLVVGGVQLDDGSWEVVVMAEGPDGVRRPVRVRP